MEFIRVEVRELMKDDLPPLILPKVGGHRRVYVAEQNHRRYLINIMAIGERADGVSYGDVDSAISGPGGPEKYFAALTPQFMQVAHERGVGLMPVAFIGIINPVGPVLLKVLETVALPAPTPLRS